MSDLGKTGAVTLGIVAAAVVVLCFFPTVARSQTAQPAKLKCESLRTPMGVDVKRPVLSWIIQDLRPGAKQTAYQVQVASKEEILASGTADVWDSGRVGSRNSIGIPYGGPELRASKRYYWRVLTWDQDSKLLAPSAVSWWEMGLLGQENWKAKWIGYEEPELKIVRESGATWITNADTEAPKDGERTSHDFRIRFDLKKSVKRAALYATGEDSSAAWVNGKQVMQADPLPPWRQMPWKTYVVKDVSGAVHTGQNVLAVEVVRYAGSSDRGPQNVAQSPMSAVLYLENTDGTVDLVKSGTGGWRAALNAGSEWHQEQFDEASWKNAIGYIPPKSGFESPDVGNPWPTGAVKSLRRTFEIAKPVLSARLYSTALGAYTLSVNGKKVGDEVLAPGWTDYRERVIYQTHDVTEYLKQGKNSLAALLGPGWYTTPLQWFGQGNNYGTTPPALRAQLRVEYMDGSVEWIATDEKWKAESSPIVKAEIYDGESYDARKAQAGWDGFAFNDTDWKSAEVIQPKEPEIVWQYFPPIRAEETLEAKSITNPSAGVYIFDFEQNLSGVARVIASGAAGTDVKLRFAEVLNPDGTLYVENLRTAKATDHFILAGKGKEEFEPKFTFHGFRYVEISGIESAPKLGDVKAVAIHTDAPFTADLKTGSPMLNHLWSNILWGQRSNFVGVPTDCPQRDERLGWSADAQVFWRTAAYNMDLATFSRKFGADLRGTQVGTEMYGIFAPGTSSPNPGYGTGWSDAGVVIPWTSWIQTGDKKVIEENWEGMERYLAAIETANPDHLWRKNYGIPFADWLAPEGTTPVDLIATAYWAYDARLMSEMAQAAGKTEDERKYKETFEKIKAAFNQAFVRPDGFVGGVPPPAVFPSGVSRVLSDKPIETQTGYVLALHMNLLPLALRAAAGNRLVARLEGNQWRLGTGFLGTPYLLSALTDTGHADVAYRLLLSTEYPSWGYLIDHGATTMWERWNGDQMRNDPSMNSYNHYAYGAVADWIYRYAAGIDTEPLKPGFQVIHLHPNFDQRLASIDFRYESSYGTIRSAWTVSGNKAVWDVTIPANASGWLPLSEQQANSFTMDGKSLTKSDKIHAANGSGSELGYEVPSGNYRFEVALP